MLHISSAQSTSGLKPTRRRHWAKKLVTGLGALLALTTISLRLLGGLQVGDLGGGSRLNMSGLQAAWAKGDIVVLVRHAERCDRSDNTCLADADGITINGSETSKSVGQHLKSLGLEHATVISSPETRTHQTAYFMFGKAAETQEWVRECDKNFTDKVLAHKKAGSNLVLITHSGCIDQFQRRMHVLGGQRASDYNQAFFISVGPAGKPKMLGSINASAWQSVLARAQP